MNIKGKIVDQRIEDEATEMLVSFKDTDVADIISAPGAKVSGGVDYERIAVDFMKGEILKIEDERALAALEEYASRSPESFSAKMTRMGNQPRRVDTVFMSEATYREVVSMSADNSATLNGVNTHSMGTLVPHVECPDCEPCEHLTEEQRETLIKMGRQIGKTETLTELVRKHPEEVLMVGHKAGMSRQEALKQMFSANYGPDPEKINLKAIRAAAESLHNATVPLEEAKQRMMDAMEKLTPEEIPLVQRELQRALVKLGPPRPVNRAQRRQVAKARRRA
jgi:hypothetical protein